MIHGVLYRTRAYVPATVSKYLLDLRSSTTVIAQKHVEHLLVVDHYQRMTSARKTGQVLLDVLDLL